MKSTLTHIENLARHLSREDQAKLAEFVLDLLQARSDAAAIVSPMGTSIHVAASDRRDARSHMTS